MILSLQKKVAIITGGSGGIGLATAQLFLKEGAQVMLVDLNEEELKTAVKSLESDSVSYCIADVSQLDQTKAYVEQTVKKFGGVDVLFANAGIEGQAGSLLDVTEKNFDQVLNVGKCKFLHKA